MFPYLNDDAVFERLESLNREVERSRLMAHGLRAWAMIVRGRLGGLTMRLPRRRSAPTRHALEDATSSDAA
jgi:hypothetical protein